MADQQQTGKTVFRARGLTKVYRMGEVEVHALRGVDLDLFSGELVVLLGSPLKKSQLLRRCKNFKLSRMNNYASTLNFLSPCSWFF